MSALRKRFSFNSNLIKARYYKGGSKALILEFHNQVNGSSVDEIDYFEMNADGCDLGFFEEFADSCIHGFHGGPLSDAECLKESQKMYQNLVRWFSNKAKCEKFLNQKKGALNGAVSKARNKSFFNLKNAQHELLVL
jgi:hypothetical protein